MLKINKMIAVIMVLLILFSSLIPVSTDLGLVPIKTLTRPDSATQSDSLPSASEYLK